jgi:microcystin-dependent protein
MPVHNHNGIAESAGAHNHSIGLGGDGFVAGDRVQRTVNNQGTTYTGTAGAHTHSLTIEANGGGQAHNNLPPYLAVYIWERVA